MVATVDAPDMTPSPVLANAPTLPSASRLLSIPPEIRNRIYRHALLSPDHIELTTTLKQPALLFTSRQVRNEATKMWYFDNQFECLIDNCDARLICRFTSHLIQKFTTEEIGKYMSVDNVIDEDTPNWANLMLWCRLVWEGKGYGPKPHVDCPPTASMVVAATDVANHMKNVGASWAMCESALKPLRCVAGHMDERWLED